VPTSQKTEDRGQRIEDRKQHANPGNGSVFFAEFIIVPIITLPDGSQKQFDKPVTVQQVAESIGPGLAKAAVAGKVAGLLVDVSTPIRDDSEVQIITASDPEGLEVIRHSAAHLLAHAVKSLYPSAQVTIGPVVEDGFYYDFAYPQGFTPEDLAQIETKMQSLAKANHPVTREVISRQDALKLFRDMGEVYKAEIIESIPEEEELTIYKQDDFCDLCRGPHVPHTGHLRAIKLTKLAGAYWRGDPANEMLQRIYGTAWPDKKSLEAYLQRIVEAEKRDHRKLAKKMGLFHFQEEAPGMVFWHPEGWQLYLQVQHYMRDKYQEYHYQEISTPQLIDRSLWEKSGHWDKYSEEMFITESERRTFAIKPMSCPGHIQVFKQGLKSYRDLPVRFGEFGCCHRNEISGALHGLMRVRSLTQDDGHVFCTEDQISQEVSYFIQQLMSIYKDFGFTDIQVNLSTRPDKRVGDDAVWDKAENALQQVLDASGLRWQLHQGEGAFYGPKIDFDLTDSLGRIWQCGTLQLDFSMPQRLEAYYIAEDGSKRPPVLLHRAVLGSLERFIGVLLEHYAGNLPLWIAPVQVVLMNITDQQADYVSQRAESFTKLGIRVKVDLRNEKIGFKIREHTIKRVPYLAVVGDKEVAAKTLAIRTQAGENLGVIEHEAFAHRLLEEINRRGGH